MKKAFIILAGVLALAACQKAGVQGLDNSMTFRVNGENLDIQVSTKATEVTSVSSVYWMATSGTVGSDTKVYDPKQLTVDAGVYNTGYFWPATSVAYNYYVSNVQFAWEGAAKIAATNATDIVAGKASASYKSSPEVTLDHIFARTGSLTLNPADGYELVGNATWKIKSNTGAGKSGSYNIGSGAWSGVTALSQQTFTGTDDLYLVPGSYHIDITYTLKKGDWEKQFTKGADVELVGGKKNNLTATAHAGSDGPQEITLTVSLTPWSDKNTEITLN